MKNDKIYKAWKKNRAERLDFLEGIDYIINNLAMSDEKRGRMKELRGNSCRYTTEQLKLKFNFILNN